MFVNMNKPERQDPFPQGADLTINKRANNHDKIHTYQLCKDTGQEQNTKTDVYEKVIVKLIFCTLVKKKLKDIRQTQI